MRDVINVLLIFQRRVITSSLQGLYVKNCELILVIDYKKNHILNCLSNIQASSDRSEKDSATE